MYTLFFLTSAARYSRTAASKTGAVALRRSAYLPTLRNLAMRPTGNWRPAFRDLETALVRLVLHLPATPVELII